MTFNKYVPVLMLKILSNTFVLCLNLQMYAVITLKTKKKRGWWIYI